MESPCQNLRLARHFSPQVPVTGKKTFFGARECDCKVLSWGSHKNVHHSPVICRKRSQMLERLKMYDNSCALIQAASFIANSPCKKSQLIKLWLTHSFASSSETPLPQTCASMTLSFHWRPLWALRTPCRH